MIRIYVGRIRAPSWVWVLALACSSLSGTASAQPEARSIEIKIPAEDLATALIDFSTAVDKVNDQKEKLGNVLSGNKKGVTDFLDQTNKPKVLWSVVLGNGPGGPWATMQPVATPFLAKPEGDAKWPDDIHVPMGDKQAVLKRYSTGNPVSDAGLFVPVDPGTQAAVCPNSVLVTLRRTISDLEDVLRGDQTPGEEKTGLIEAGQNLSKKLKQIGANPAS